jgi:hypothetical protein
MEQKNNKGLIITIVIISLLVLGVGGYLVYHILLNDKETRAEEPVNDDKKEREYLLDTAVIRAYVNIEEQGELGYIKLGDNSYPIAFIVEDYAEDNYSEPMRGVLTIGEADFVFSDMRFGGVRLSVLPNNHILIQLFSHCYNELTIIDSDLRIIFEKDMVPWLEYYTPLTENIDWNDWEQSDFAENKEFINWEDAYFIFHEHGTESNTLDLYRINLAFGEAGIVIHIDTIAGITACAYMER